MIKPKKRKTRTVELLDTEDVDCRVQTWSGRMLPIAKDSGEMTEEREVRRDSFDWFGHF